MKKEIKYFGLSVLGMALSLTVYHHYFTHDSKTIIQEIPVEQNPVPVQNTSLLPGMIPMNTTGGLENFTDASESTVNSVVHVNTTVVQTQRYSDPMLEFFFGPDAGTRERKFKGSGSGSGVIISDDGYIITNNHVINHAQEINIILNDNTEYNASVVGTDPSTDLALLKIDAEGLPAIKMGNSSEVKIGEWVLAVGNPFNLNSTVTAGIVSAKARNINIIRPNAKEDVFPIESFIQTDAAVNPGNSGGALVNTKGELIGINTAIASGTGYYTGYSFAIPINLVQKVIADLRDFGSVKRALLGVQISDINQELKEKEQLNTTVGVFVADVVENGAAEKAGIKKGDVITHINNVAVTSSPQLQVEIGQKNPNETIIVSLIRDQKEYKLPVKLKGVKSEELLSSKEKAKNVMGATVKDASPEELKVLGISKGVKVEKLHPGKIMAAGVPKGFIITKVDNNRINNADELVKYLSSKKGGILIEGYYPNGEKGYFGFGA